MPLVDATRDLGVPAGAENGRGAGIRVHAGEVLRRQWKAAILVMDRLSCRAGRRRTWFHRNRRSSPPKMRAQNLKAGIHVREERRQVCSEAAVLKIEQAAHPSARGNGLEEAGRGLVGVNARRREQAHESRWA